MISYPQFVAALDGRDVDDLAERAGVSAESIRAIASGDLPPSLSTQMRLAAALGEVNPFDLFQLGDVDLARAAGRDVEAQGHPRYATDADALRATEAATR